jgi:hypothetical protein
MLKTGAAAPSALTADSTLGGANGKSRFSVLTRLLRALRRPPPRLQPNPLLAVGFRKSICEYFCARDGAAIGRALSENLPAGAKVSVIFDAASVRQQMCCIWAQSRTGGTRFTFPILQSGQLLEVVVERWLSLFDLFLAMARRRQVGGSTVINLSDCPVEPGLAFCGNAPQHILLPDFEFLQSRGYREARFYFDLHQPRWEERSPRVFWRGSSVGQKDHPILEMPRARLCLLGREMGEAWGDIGLAALFHISEADANELRCRQLMKEKAPWQTLSQYRFHIDIDGHASCFSALFRKLLSGGLVLKVQSPDRFRQWYYHQLVPGVNYVPVRSDLGDLVEIVAHYRERARLAESIARRGRELALSLTYEKEFAFALQASERAFASTLTSASAAGDRRAGRCA